jgi:uncharacterized membrane protein
MTKLTLGVLLFCIVHLIPSLLPDLKKSLSDRLGEYPYKGLFTLLMVFSVFLIVTGWKSSTLESLYVPPIWGSHFTALLVLAAFILFGAPYPANNIKRILRHPQLLGTVCWCLGHLLANGELRSIILFGGLGVWAVAEMLLINRREGEWTRPDPAPLRNDVSLVAISVLVYAMFLYSHEWLLGVAPMG